MHRRVENCDGEHIPLTLQRRTLSPKVVGRRWRCGLGDGGRGAWVAISDEAVALAGSGLLSRSSASLTSHSRQAQGIAISTLDLISDLYKYSGNKSGRSRFAPGLPRKVLLMRYFGVAWKVSLGCYYEHVKPRQRACREQGQTTPIRPGAASEFTTHPARLASYHSPSVKVPEQGGSE